MAERCPSSSAKVALDKLNEQLTCSVCLEQFTNPKLLNCFHIFCEKCLELVAQRQGGNKIPCPNCRHFTPLPQQGVPGLQGAFLMTHLFDVQDILKKVSMPAGAKCTKCKKRDPACYCRTCGFLCEACKTPHVDWDEFASHELVSLDQLTEDATKLVPPVKKTPTCSKHPTKELDLYCETCKEVICQHCTVKAHRDHKYDLASDVFPQQREVLVSSVKPAEDMLVLVNKALDDLQALRGTITDQSQQLEKEIKTDIQLAHRALETREQELLTMLDQLTQQKLKNAAGQQDQLELMATRLKSCSHFLQESLRTGSDIEILSMSQSFQEQVEDVNTSVKPESLIPAESADLDYSRNQRELQTNCQQFGQVTVNQVCHDKCKVDGTGIKLAIVDQATTVMVNVLDQKGKRYKNQVEMSIEVVSRDGSIGVKGETKKVGDGQYEISYTPQCRGPHHLHILLDRRHIAGSPYPLSVIATKPSKVISGVKGPWGIQLDSQGQLVVTENSGHCVTVFSQSGRKLKTFGTCGLAQGQLSYPVGLLITKKDDIIVADQLNNRIQVFSPDGRSIKCVGERSGPLQFTRPFSLTRHPHSNKIYITECGINNRVQVLNEDLTFYDTFGSTGSGNGQFKRPLDIKCDSKGNLYVADTDNHRIQVFSKEGAYIRQFGK